MGEKMEEKIPLKSINLEHIFNSNIGDYGYKKVTQHNTSDIEEPSNRLEETYRTDLRRQRDKILYTGGFRRLQDKTQVISATREGDHRTRLTHTLEVEQIAISIANALKLNVDLVSAIALGHDVGHTPFGHAAERKLCSILEEKGKFHHPIQSVRYIWEKYGCKIDSVIYEGILLHDSDMFEIDKADARDQLKYLKNGKSKLFRNWVEIDKWLNSFPSTLEAQVVIWADKIAYITHDLEDFLRCPSYVNLKKNDNKIEKELCKILSKLIKKKIKNLKEYESRDLIRNIVKNLIKFSVANIEAIPDFKQKDVRKETKKRSEAWQSSGKNKKYLDSLIINFSDKYRLHYYRLREFLDNYYIFSPEVQKSDAKAEVIIEWLFKKLADNYKLMPLNLRDEVDEAILHELRKCKKLKKIYKRLKNGQNSISHFEKNLKKQYKEEYDKYKLIKNRIVSRKVASYIATMSDTYAENMYRNLTGSTLDFRL